MAELMIQVAVVVAVTIGLLFFVLFAWTLLKAGKRGEIERERINIVSGKYAFCLSVYSTLRGQGPLTISGIQRALAHLEIRLASSQIEKALEILQSERLVRRQEHPANSQAPSPCWEVHPDRDKE